jgi:hypothetical protein
VNQLLLSRIIWSALIFSVMIYGVLVVALPAQDRGEPGALLSILAAVAALFAVMSFSLKFLIRSLLAKKNSSGAFLVSNIVAFALAEAVALFGFILHLLGAPLSASLAFFGVGLLLLAAHFPMPEKREKRFGDQ